MAMLAQYKPPEIHNFPPLFTIQPVEQTRAKQLHSWTKIITEYHEFHKKTVLSLSDFELFENATIKRALDADGRRKVVEHLISKGYADWVQPDNKTECMVFYKPLDEWAKLVYDWARRYGNIGDVFTIYDLIEGDDSANEPFNGLDARVFYRIVARMQKQNLCQVFDNSNVEEVGVKFI